jgi:hypothetical protein
MSGDFSEKAASQTAVSAWFVLSLQVHWQLEGFKAQAASVRLGLGDHVQCAARLGNAIRVRVTVKQLATGSNSRFATRRFLYTRMHWHACARIYDVSVCICSV